jgi:hypothetical protein
MLRQNVRMCCKLVRSRACGGIDLDVPDNCRDLSRGAFAAYVAYPADKTAAAKERSGWHVGSDNWIAYDRVTVLSGTAHSEVCKKMPHTPSALERRR